MSALTQLFRDEIRNLKPYQAAQYADGFLRLNANETPWDASGDAAETGLHRYPDERPLALAARLASLYGVAPEQCLVTRGSSEAIELVIRATCRPGQDDILICPPTFGMYAAYAQLQGAGVVSVPLNGEAGFALNNEPLAGAWTSRCRVLFLCSPNNPTGNSLSLESIGQAAADIGERGLVVIDGAYLEFAAEDPTQALLALGPNVIVLRTLSKALGLAGIRCGALLGDPEVVSLVTRLMPPYSVSSPCTAAAFEATTGPALDLRIQLINGLRDEKSRVSAALKQNPRIRKVWPSDANFVLVEADDAKALVARARDGGVLIRDFSRDPLTPGGVRITIGTPAQNDQLLAAVA